jgi:putative transposon-encoded protein
MLVNINFLRENKQNSVVASDITQKMEITYKKLVGPFGQTKRSTRVVKKGN